MTAWQSPGLCSLIKMIKKSASTYNDIINADNHFSFENQSVSSAYITEWLNSALSPVVYGDIALSINT